MKNSPSMYVRGNTIKEGRWRANREYTTEKGGETHVKKKILERGENISIKSAETMLPRESQC